MSKAVVTTRTADGTTDLEVDGPDRVDVDNTGTLRLSTGDGPLLSAFAPGQWLAARIVTDTPTGA